MDSYIKYLTFVGLFVTIITIILFFVMYNYSGSTRQWPPKSSTCPDYWTLGHDDTNGPMCYDTLRMSPNDDHGAVFHPNTVISRYSMDDTSFTAADTIDGLDDQNMYKAWGGIPANGGRVDYTNIGCTISHDTVNGMSGANYVRGGVEKQFGSASEWATHCGKKRWANDNALTWDGITNSNVDCTLKSRSDIESDELEAGVLSSL